MAVTKKEIAPSKFEGIPSKIEKVSEELSCELNDVEWSNRAREFADAQRATEAMKNRKKSVMAELNADLKVAEAKEDKLASIVANKREQREVTVDVKYDYEKGLVTKTRTDTKEAISTREMTTSERQGGLFEETQTDADTFIEERHEDKNGAEV